MNRRSLFKYLTATFVGLTAAGSTATYFWSRTKNKSRVNLLIAGSAPMAPYIQKVAHEFSKAHANVDIVIEKGHSRAGLLALQRGGVDIAMMDRDLTTKESSLSTRSQLVRMDAIALVVHPDSPVSKITEQQARLAFEGEITNWKELGGQDAKINLYSRVDRSTTKTSIEDILMAGGLISPAAIELETARDISNAVANDVNSLGYLSLRNLNGKTKALEISNTAVSEQAILVGTYPLTREMFFVETIDSAPITKQFIDFTISPKGQAILVDAGWLRVR